MEKSAILDFGNISYRKLNDQRNVSPWLHAKQMREEQRRNYNDFESTRLKRYKRFNNLSTSSDQDELIERKPKTSIIGRIYNWLVIEILFFFVFIF